MKKERQIFRVKISPLKPVEIQFKLAGGPRGALVASVDDISIGGVGILLAASVPLSVGQRVLEGRLHLPEAGPVPFEGVIRWHSDRRLGIEFTNMPEKNRRLIFQFVAQRERESLPNH